uniref:Oxidoreductase n=1 Tax=Streptomyces sp. FR1 TaxID=349971 RepID=V9Z294_9ACTN|nr:Gfo/Idh/MocA family oxidoreductase [Streptomyces sp. FR1]AHE38687.1 Oxidoreductase [Streptomyces sp. FR1]
MAVGVGVVGYGAAGRQHAAALEMASGLRLVGVVDADPAADTGTLPRYESLSALLHNPAVGLVALCLPPGSRAKAAHEIIRAGRALLIEKPPAMTVAELDSMAAHAADRALPAGVMLQHRMRLAGEIQSGTFRAPDVMAALEVSRYRPVGHYRERGWRGRPKEALGGIVAHLGIHYLDLACQLLGPPVDIREAGRRERLPGIDSRVAAVVLFESGAVLSMAVSAESAVRGERLAVYAPERRLVLEDGQVTVTTESGRITSPAEPTPALRRRVYEEMAHAIENGTAPAVCALDRARGVTWLMQELASSKQETPC